MADNRFASLSAQMNNDATNDSIQSPPIITTTPPPTSSRKTPLSESKGVPRTPTTCQSSVLDNSFFSQASSGNSSLQGVSMELSISMVDLEKDEEQEKAEEGFTNQSMDESLFKSEIETEEVKGISTTTHEETTGEQTSKLLSIPPKESKMMPGQNEMDQQSSSIGQIVKETVDHSFSSKQSESAENKSKDSLALSNSMTSELEEIKTFEPDNTYNCNSSQVEGSDILVKSLNSVIKALLIENQNYRKNEEKISQEKSELEKEVQMLREELEASPQKERNRLEEELKMKDRINESFTRSIGELEESGREDQLKIAELGQEIIRLENLVAEYSSEKDTLQKLLSNSRELASVAMSKNKEKKSKVETTGEVQNVDVGSKDNKDEDKNQSFDPVGLKSENSDDVITLRNELKAAKRREDSLREQLNLQLDELIKSALLAEDPEEFKSAKSNLRDAKFSIMDSLSESQQEAIIYLSREVEELRLQVEKDKKDSKERMAILEKKEEEIEMLQEENELFASEIVANEIELESLHKNFSAKLGENACLRDEVQELEGQVKNIPQLKADLEDAQFRLQQLESNEQKVIKLEASLQEKRESLRVMTKKVARNFLYQEDNNEGRQLGRSLLALQVDDEMSLLTEDGALPKPPGQHDSSSSQPSTPRQDNDRKSVEDKNNSDSKRNREVTVLKKALKQKYESKYKEFELKLKCKDAEISLLKENLAIQEASLSRQEEVVKEQIVTRISQEAELNQQQQEMINVLAERDEKIVKLKSKLAEIKNGDSDTWRVVSDSVCSGVNAGINAFHVLSNAASAEFELDKEVDKKINTMIS